MRRWSIALGIVVAAVAAGVVAIRGGLLPFSWPAGDAEVEVLDRYCEGCHNDAELAGGVSFQRLDREQLTAHADVGEAVVRKLRTGLMPPLGEPRPERAVLDAFAASLEAGLDAAWVRAPNPGTRPLARLTRTEYANAIRDLLAYDASAIASTLPPDATVGGFDNNAAALGVSPTLLEGYATAAMQIGRRAVGDRTMGHGETRYTALPGAAQRAPIEGLPLGTRGGLAVEHTFPLDAEYELVVSAAIPAAGWNNPTGALVYCDGPAVDVTFNGAPVAVENPRRIRLRVPAGPQRITVALVDERRCAGVNELYAGETGLGGAVQALTIVGPFDATGAGDTPSRSEIFVCRPSRLPRTRAWMPAVEQRREQLPTGRAPSKFSRGSRRARTAAPSHRPAVSSPSSCASTRRAARRAATSTPASGTRCRACSWTRGSSIGSSASPTTLPSAPCTRSTTSSSRRGCRSSSGAAFRTTSCSRSRPRGGSASRPCSPPKSIACSPTRARRRSSRTSRASGCCCASSTPSCRRIRTSTTDLRAAMRRETELLFADLVREPRSVLTLLDADYTYLNERLAAHYGVDGVRGSHMRRVAWPADSPRLGVLGHGSILTATSAPNRTSPVVRGQWLMQSLLGAKIPSPPPGAEADLSAEASESEGLVGDTVRERLELHRANPTCAGCHGIMDPLGLCARELRFARAGGATARTATPSMPRRAWSTARRSADRRICAQRCSRARMCSSRR